MKITKVFVLLLIVSFALNINLLAQKQTHNDKCTMKKAEKWFKSGAWRNGLTLNVHESVNIVEFANQYNKNKIYWDKAFAYLRTTSLETVAPGKYYLDSTNVFVSVTENPTKDLPVTKWEAHRKYLDIQLIVTGKEMMGIAPFSKATVVEAYNPASDVGFYSVADADSKFYVAQPGTFLIFFPTDAHRPSIKTDGIEKTKKVVIKIKMD